MQLRLGVVCGVLGVMSMQAAARAQTRPAETAAREGAPPVTPRPLRRELNGHIFAPSELVMQPFTETRFRSTTSFGVARTEATTIDSLGAQQATTRDFRQAAYTQNFALQVGLLPWLAVRANAGGTFFVGLSGPALLRLGSAVQYGGGGGVTIGGRVGPGQLAFVCDAQYAPTTTVSVLAAVMNAVETRQVSDFDLVNTNHLTPVRSGVSGAIALAKPLGLAVDARYQHTFGGAGALSLQDAFIGAASLDFDFHAFTPVPIGLVAAYQIQVPFGPDDRSTLWHALNFGVLYTGREDLSLGLEFSAKREPQRFAILSESISAALVVRYYW